MYFGYGCFRVDEHAFATVQLHNESSNKNIYWVSIDCNCALCFFPTVGLCEGDESICKPFRKKFVEKVLRSPPFFEINFEKLE